MFSCHCVWHIYQLDPQLIAHFASSPYNQFLTNRGYYKFLEHAERKITKLTVDEAFELFSVFKFGMD